MSLIILNQEIFIVEVASSKWKYKRYIKYLFINETELNNMKTKFNSLNGIEYTDYTVDKKMLF